MELTQAIKDRYSERRFQDLKPDREVLVKIIKSAQEAPNSCNMQAMHFLVVDDPSLQKQLANIATKKMLWAPTNIFLLHDSRFTKKRSSGVMSLGASMQNMCLTATDLGLATCPMAGFENDQKIKQILKIPEHYDLMLILGVGYPASEEKRKRARVQTSDLVSYNSFDHSKIKLKSSTNMTDWNLSDVTEYRKRIGPVYRYRDRYSLANFSEKIYSELASLAKKYALNNKAIILDLFTYDGVFVRELTEVLPENTIIIADTVDSLQEVNCDIASKVSKVNLGSDYHVDLPDNTCDVVTCIHKLQFTPSVESVFAETYRILKPGGVFMVSIDVEPLFKRLIEGFVNKVWFKLTNKTWNVYENNKNYKIGPKHYLKTSRLKSLAKTLNLDLIHEKTASRDVGAKIKHTYYYAVFQK